MSLNARQSRFLAEYLQSGNATQAAITAGYSEKTADQIGSTLLKNVDIAAQVAKAARANEVTIEHWVKEVSRMAFDIKPVNEFTYDHKLKSSDHPASISELSTMRRVPGSYFGSRLT